MESNKISDNVSEMTGNIKEYVRLRLDLLKLSLTEKLARLASFCIILLIICIVFLFFSLFISIAFVLWFREYVGPVYVGALIVAGFYLLLGAVVYLFRNSLFVNPFISMLSKVFLEDHDEDDEE
jgi:hypothetical protein